MAEKQNFEKKPEKEQKKEVRKEQKNFREINVSNLKNFDKDTKLIVRICGKDLNGTKTITMALTSIKGIGQRFGSMIANAFQKESGMPANSRLGKLSEEQDKLIEDIIQNPIKHGIPGFFANRQNDLVTGESRQLIMSDLDFSLRQDLQKMGRIKSYKGLRHAWGLTVRGQRTRSTHHHGGRVVGVVKKLLVPGAAADEGKKK